jgi:hypothetical protein
MSRPDDAARAEAQRQQAEADRIAAEAQRDVAWNVAADQAVNRDIAEAREVDARIAANQAGRAASEAETQRNLLNNELSYERAAASNNAFGFYLTLGILIAALIVGGCYLYWRSNNPDTVVVNAAPAPAASAPAPVVVTQPPAPSAPPVINVTPPVVHNHIAVTPPAAPPANPPANSSDTNSSGTDNTGTDSSGTNSGGSTDSGTQNNSGSQ